MKPYDKLIQIRSNDLPPAGGRVLISEPFLDDFYFQRAVVLLVDHHVEGSFGLVINKPLFVPLEEVLLDFPFETTKVYLGGPVQPDQVFFIHTLGHIIENSLAITPDGVFWGGDIEKVKELATEGKLNEENIRFFIGYSGWESGQLDSELKRNSWVVSPINREAIFSPPESNLWSQLLTKMGSPYRLWVDYPGNPNDN